VVAQEAEKSSPFGSFVAGAFAFGWLLGLVAVLRIWDLVHAPRWMLFGGVGYVTLMLAPALVGFAFVRGMGQLASRGWGTASLGLLAAGLGGLVAGLYVH
jgi:hypothetical protein